VRATLLPAQHSVIQIGAMGPHGLIDAVPDETQQI
jgi:hypothetical protein